MDDLEIDVHALKHGLTPEEIAYAWTHTIAKQRRTAPDDDRTVAVGYDPAGRFVQMVSVDKPFGTLIIHAMEPPTLNVLIELGLTRR